MAVRLHRCSTLWAKTSGHPCWRVQRALDEAGVPYEIVKETPLLRGRRKAVIAGTGQSKVPAIQLEDGSWYRKESSEMADEIRAGALSGHRLGRVTPTEVAAGPRSASTARRSSNPASIARNRIWHCCYACLRAHEPGAARTPARDDTQSSAAVLSSRLVSAVGASMSDGPVRPASTPRDRRLEP